MSQDVNTDEFEVCGDRLVAKVKELVRQGNIRRIIIKNDKGKVLISITLTIGVVGTVIFPLWAALGAVVALGTRCTIVVKRERQHRRHARR